MALSIFGAQRCMFATHCPIDHPLWDGNTVVSTVQAALADLSAKQQAEFIGQTARRVYQMPG
jgi:predicted TIM-barrel fold metal-dependent hydrolase